MDAVWKEGTRPKGRVGSEIEVLLLGLILLSLAAKLHLVLARQINWDEFYYLSFVHRYGDGSLTVALQTLHVHAFQWLGRVGVNEVSQIVAARLVLFALSLATTWLVYDLARRFLERPGALAATAAYAGFNFVLLHGASFRTDPIATFLLMTGLRLVLAQEKRWAAIATAGLLWAVAFLVTAKSVFYAPSLIVLLLASAPGATSLPRRLAEPALLSLCAAAGFVLLYALHESALAAPPSDAVSEGAHLSGAYQKTVSSAGFFPQFSIFWRSVLGNGLVWPAIVAGGLIALHGLLRAPPERRARWLALGALAAPATSLLFYRNSFPYFYPMILAPAAVLAGLAAESLLARPQRWALSLLRAGVVTLFATLLMTYVVGLRDGLADQRRLLAAVHRIFPEPVAYIDRCSMVSAFPKAGFFMSSWGMENYLAAGRPLMREIIERDQPAFLLANVSYLEEAFDDPGSAEEPPILLAQDVAVLRDNYIPHWGPIHVAGKTLRREGAAARPFEILIAGTYTLEAAGAVLIDGRIVRPGEQVSLNRGRHRLQASAPATDIVLRWGANLPRPDERAPVGPVFRGF